MRSIKQKGFSAVIAIVIVVLLAIIGATMATLTTTSFLNTTSSTLGIQSWFAAQSAVEWAVHTAVNRTPAICTCGTNCCTTGNSGMETSITGATINFTNGGLGGYQAEFDGTTGCSESSVTEGGATYCIYQIDVLGSHDSAGDLTYASRRIKISVTDNNAP